LSTGEHKPSGHNHNRDHNDDHDHDHEHGLGHGHNLSRGHHHSHHTGHHHHHHFGDSAVRNIGIAFGLNLFFAVIEFVGGLWLGSLAILADAVHDLGDSISLGLALILQKLSTKDRNSDFTYGYGRLSLLSALIAGLVILGGSLFILIESVPRLWNSQPAPSGRGMIAFAIIGILVNGVAVLKLSKGKTQNEKLLRWHLLEDVLGWLAVLVGSIVIALTSWTWVDPALAIGLSIFVMWNVSRGLWRTAGLFLQRAPENFSYDKFRSSIATVTGVRGLHDLHAWSIDGSRNILSLHVIVDAAPEHREKIHEIKVKIREIAKGFGHFHTTIEVEYENDPCVDDCEQPKP
jgi:cobalt-zinc-cadmium efflux system protein